MEIVDVGPAGLEVGSPFNMVFRIKERDRCATSTATFGKPPR